MEIKTKIKIVIPDGSMESRTLDLFKRTGMEVIIEKERIKRGKVIGIDWIESVTLLKPQIIPLRLKEDYFDVALVGWDWIAERGYEKEFSVLFRLPIGRKTDNLIKIVLAVSRESKIQKAEDLPQGCTIATEYVGLAERFLSKIKRTDIRIIQSYGNTEQEVQYGAEAIIDVKETGESLEQNNLKVVCEIMESPFVIVASRRAYGNKNKRAYIDYFASLIKAAHHASQHVMLMANVPKRVLKEAAQILGGLKAPTCSLLIEVTEEGDKPKEKWFALQSVVPRIEEHEKMFALRQIGVTDIVIQDISLIMS